LSKQDVWWPKVWAALQRTKEAAHQCKVAEIHQIFNFHQQLDPFRKAAHSGNCDMILHLIQQALYAHQKQQADIEKTQELSHGFMAGLQDEKEKSGMSFDDGVTSKDPFQRMLLKHKKIAHVLNKALDDEEQKLEHRKMQMALAKHVQIVGSTEGFECSTDIDLPADEAIANSAIPSINANNGSANSGYANVAADEKQRNTAGVDDDFNVSIKSIASIDLIRYINSPPGQLSHISMTLAKANHMYSPVFPSALWIATSARQIQVIDLILSHQNILSSSQTSWDAVLDSCLDQALRRGYVEIVKKLLDRGAQFLPSHKRCVPPPYSEYKHDKVYKRNYWAGVELVNNKLRANMDAVYRMPALVEMKWQFPKPRSIVSNIPALRTKASLMGDVDRKHKWEPDVNSILKRVHTAAGRSQIQVKFDQLIQDSNPEEEEFINTSLSARMASNNETDNSNEDSNANQPISSRMLPNGKPSSNQQLTK
jgi:hypothetical protein